MKPLLLYLFFQFSVLIGFSQLDTLSKNFMLNILKHEPGSDTIVYTNKLKSVSTPLLPKVLKSSTIVAYELQTRRKKTISLSKSEKKELAEDMDNTTWDSLLFSNSKMIPADSMWTYISTRQREFSKIALTNESQENSNILINNRVSYCSVFQFSKPAFLRNNTLAIFYFLRICGSECGIEDLSVYKLENGQYKKWLVIGGSAF